MLTTGVDLHLPRDGGVLPGHSPAASGETQTKGTDVIMWLVAQW